MSDKFVNQVVINGQTVIDLTEDTVTPDTLMDGETAHDKTGRMIVGRAVPSVGGAVSDWNQNDETQPDYIKNRTHYKVPNVISKSYHGAATNDQSLFEHFWPEAADALLEATEDKIAQCSLSIRYNPGDGGAEVNISSTLQTNYDGIFNFGFCSIFTLDMWGLTKGGLSFREGFSCDENGFELKLNIGDEVKELDPVYLPNGGEGVGYSSNYKVNLFTPEADFDYAEEESDSDYPWCWFEFFAPEFKNVSVGDEITVDYIHPEQGSSSVSFTVKQGQYGLEYIDQSDETYPLMYVGIGGGGYFYCEFGMALAAVMELDDIVVKWTNIHKIDRKYLDISGGDGGNLPTINIFDYMYQDGSGEYSWVWDMPYLNELYDGHFAFYDEISSNMSMFVSEVPFVLHARITQDLEAENARLFDIRIEAGQVFGLAEYTPIMSREPMLRFKFGDKEFGIPSGFNVWRNTGLNGISDIFFVYKDIRTSLNQTGLTWSQNNTRSVSVGYGEYIFPKLAHEYVSGNEWRVCYIEYEGHNFLMSIEDPYASTYYAYDLHPQKLPVRVCIHNAVGNDGWSVEPYDYSGGSGGGSTPVRGVDYWTAEDIAEIKSYVDNAIIGGEW